MAAAFAAAPILAGVVLAGTAVSAGAAIFGAVRGAQAAEEQRAAEELAERQASIQGVQRANEILQQEIDTLAAVNVAAGASGIDPFTGSPATTKRRIRERANRQLRTVQTETEFARAGSRSRQRQLSLSGEAATLRGLSAAGGAAVGGVQQLSAIG